MPHKDKVGVGVEHGTSSETGPETDHRGKESKKRKSYAVNHKDERVHKEILNDSRKSSKEKHKSHERIKSHEKRNSHGRQKSHERHQHKNGKHKEASGKSPETTVHTIKEGHRPKQVEMTKEKPRGNGDPQIKDLHRMVNDNIKVGEETVKALIERDKIAVATEEEAQKLKSDSQRLHATTKKVYSKYWWRNKRFLVTLVVACGALMMLAAVVVFVVYNVNTGDKDSLIKGGQSRPSGQGVAPGGQVGARGSQGVAIGGQVGARGSQGVAIGGQGGSPAPIALAPGPKPALAPIALVPSPKPAPRPQPAPSPQPAPGIRVRAPLSQGPHPQLSPRVPAQIAIQPRPVLWQVPRHGR